MLLDAFGEVSWWAVAAATLASYLLGALWFTPLFGRLWDRSLDHERVRGRSFAPLYYVAPFVSSALTTVATAVLLETAQIRTAGGAVVLGLLVGVCYAAAVTFTNAVNPRTPRPVLFAAVTGSYHVVSIVLGALLLVALGR
jgi:MFS family permease